MYKTIGEDQHLVKGPILNASTPSIIAWRLTDHLGQYRVRICEHLPESQGFVVLHTFPDHLHCSVLGPHADWNLWSFQLDVDESTMLKMFHVLFRCQESHPQSTKSFCKKQLPFEKWIMLWHCAVIAANSYAYILEFDPSVSNNACVSRSFCSSKGTEMAGLCRFMLGLNAVQRYKILSIGQTLKHFGTPFWSSERYKGTIWGDWGTLPAGFETTNTWST